MKKVVYTGYFKQTPRSRWRWATTSYATTHAQAIQNALNVKFGYPGCHDYKVVPGEPKGCDTWQGSYRETFRLCGKQGVRVLCHDPEKIKQWGHPAELVGRLYECQRFGGVCSSHTCRKGNKVT